MKVLVTEINQKVLAEFIPMFGLASQITFLEKAEIPDDCKKHNSIAQPYYIEECINDLEKVLSICDDVDYSRTPIRKKVDWNEFCGFWELILNIQKQREIGYPTTNIEYIYKKGIQRNLSIELKHASVDLGFEPQADYYVIIGESPIGKMQLYQDCDDFSEYVFVLEYEKVSRFSKKKVADITHWHPRGYQRAMEDMIAFMHNDKEYFKRLGIKLK